MIFEWNPHKAKENLAKHGVSFTEAETAFEDFFAVESLDAEHSTADEVRYKMLAMSEVKILVVVYTMRREIYRIISAREAESYERKFYERQRAEDFGAA